MMQRSCKKLMNVSTTMVAGVRPRSFSHSPRTPLIKFLGKRDPKKPIEHASSRPAPAPAPTPKIAPPTSQQEVSSTNKKPGFTPKPVKPHHRNAVDYFQLKNGVMHGRKRLSAEEIEAIELGGAH